MCAKMISTRIMFWTSMTCVQRTLPLVKLTSADSRWFLWIPRVLPRLIPTGWSVTRAKSWCRPSTAILALLLVRQNKRTSYYKSNHSEVSWHCWRSKPSRSLFQVMMSSVQSISAERSSSTRTEMMTTLGSCSATSPAHASTQSCGNRSRRLTGQPHLQKPRATLACQSKWSTQPLVPVNI